jgi:E3 ubiquitin-protein ligase EDD1
MTSIQFVVHPLPGTQEQLQEKLREVADRLNKYNTSGTERHPVYSVFRIRTGSGSREAEGFFCSL